jgi:hypothetical protein
MQPSDIPMDFIDLYDVLFRTLFAFFFVVHGTWEAVHLNVTRCPTDAWVAPAIPGGHAVW